MSWQAHVDNILTPDQSGTAPVQEAAICGFGKGQESVWASTAGYSVITADEIRKLAGDRSTFFQNGVFIAGQKCRVLRDLMEDSEQPSLLLKTAPDAEGNTYNITVAKTKTAFVIGRGTSAAQGGPINTKVCNAAKYLMSSGY